MPEGQDGKGADADPVGRTLLDRAAIQDLVYGYARAVDRRDRAALAALFTADGYGDYGYFSAGVPELFDLICTGLAQFDSTMHFVGNHLAEVQGDTARAETYTIAYHRLAIDGQAMDLVVAMLYTDDLVRETAGWRFRRRTIRTLWERRDAVG